ncbi:MAG: TRAP transporter substrate-binding protein DctP [Myxococcales bacterium]|nr:TRAP transporter substrate-binding protein DctP [Myxococcales bacterium]
MRKAIACTLILAFAMAIPGSTSPAQAKAKNLIRIATLAPRNTDLTRGFQKIDQGLKTATNGEWGIRLYPSGVAGDEKDVIRKMRVGQMDASIVTTTGLAQIVREVAVLNAPGVITNYTELERVQKSMNKEWEQTFEKSGFKLISWGESGQYRYFSKAPVTRPGDLKNMRPWLWPESHVMKEIYKAVGANGVPLGLPEVYGALQTKMIDAVIATSLALVALQWHSKLDHVTNETSGVLLGAMIMNSKKWESIPADVKSTLEEEIRKNTEGDSKSVRKNDLRAYKKLLKRGYTGTNYSAQGKKEYDDMSATVRKRMTGRVYPQALLDRVIKIARGG